MVAPAFLKHGALFQAGQYCGELYMLWVAYFFYSFKDTLAIFTGDRIILCPDS